MKDLPPDVPRLDPVPFVVADIVLVGFAAFLGWQAEAPLGAAPLAAIAACVGLGAIAGLYPFVVNHARRQEEALQDRANQIEALARTVAASAEQISIAAASLPAIAEIATRQLKAAEQLPAALQSQLQALQLQVSATAHEENAALRHELDTLRGAETNKLVVALENLNRGTQDISRLEALAAKHASTLDEALAHLPRVAETFRDQATDTLRRETANAVSALEAATDSARIKIDASAHATQAAVATAAAQARATLESAVQAASALLAAAVPTTPAPVPPPAIAAVATPPPENSAPAQPEAPPPPLLIDDVDLDEPTAPPLVEPTPKSDPEPAPEITPAEPSIVEPPPSPPIPIPTPSPELQLLKEQPSPELTLAEAEATPEPEPEPEPESEPEPDPAPAHAEPALSNDGFTRLIATAYIGIGNKLFIRGDGPGLRRDKGVPLQFVSIGKWRWESAELLFPAKVRLYKNDQIECVTLGEFALEPGHHHEVNATF
jgi:hypothetical protein